MCTMFRAALLLSVVIAMSASASAQYYRYNYYDGYGYYGSSNNSYFDNSLIRRLDADHRGGFGG